MKTQDRLQFKFEPRAEIGTAVLYITGCIGVEPEEDGVSEKGFAEALTKAKDYEKIQLVINSGGGSTFLGIKMYNQLRETGKQISVLVEGLAASMASALLMVAPVDRREMYSNAKIMVHGPRTGAWGTETELQSQLDVLKSVKADLVKIYIEGTGKSEAEVLEWMSKDTWFDAKTAKANGLVGTIKETKKAAPTATSDVREVVAFYNDLNQDSAMKYILIAQALGMLEDATEAQIVAAITTLNAKVAQMEANTHTAIIEAAVSEGKLTAENKKVFEGLLKKDFEGTVAAIKSLPGKPAAPVAEVVKEEPRVADIIAAMQKQGVGAPVAKTFDWMLKNEPKALMALEKDNPAEFAKLYKAQYGVEPQAIADVK